jgi:hypothetical protein
MCYDVQHNKVILNLDPTAREHEVLEALLQMIKPVSNAEIGGLARPGGVGPIPFVVARQLTVSSPEDRLARHSSSAMTAKPFGPGGPRTLLTYLTDTKTDVAGS